MTELITIDIDNKDSGVEENIKKRIMRPRHPRISPMGTQPETRKKLTY